MLDVRVHGTTFFSIVKSYLAWSLNSLAVIMYVYCTKLICRPLCSSLPAYTSINLTQRLCTCILVWARSAHSDSHLQCIRDSTHFRYVYILRYVLVLFLAECRCARASTMYYTYYRIGLQFSWDLIFAVFADTTASTKIIQRIFSNTHECAPILYGRANGTAKFI